VRTLPRSTRRLYRPTVDPKATPFIEKLTDVRRVFLALPEPINVAFAVGAFGGLRTGEVLGLEWADIDLRTGRIHVKRQVQDGTATMLKDDETRIVPVMDALAPILRAWHLKTGGTGPLFRPKVATRGGRPGAPPTFVRGATLRRHLADALDACKLAPLTWYQATRHTFASQWVLANGSIEKLAHVMGHSSTVVTQRYAHLRTDLFRPDDLALLKVDLTPGGQVTTLRPGPSARAKAGTDGYAVVTETSTRRTKRAKSA
jgi:integrase